MPQRSCCQPWRRRRARLLWRQEESPACPTALPLSSRSQRCTEHLLRSGQGTPHRLPRLQKPCSCLPPPAPRRPPRASSCPARAIKPWPQVAQSPVPLHLPAACSPLLPILLKVLARLGFLPPAAGENGVFTSPYRGVTRHRLTGRFEAHYWDSSYVRPNAVSGHAQPFPGLRINCGQRCRLCNSWLPSPSALWSACLDLLR
jgi:hypothetical protein